MQRTIFSIAMIAISSLLLAYVLSSCSGKPQESFNEGDFRLHLLFEHDGCKMYRFSDGSRSVYWSDCRGKTSYEEEYRRSGKATIIKRSETETSAADPQN